MTKKSKYTVRADGRIVHSVTINGKRKFFYGRTDKDIDKQMLAYRAELSAGRRFRELAEEWQAAHDMTVNRSTAQAYAFPTQKIIERIGDTPIKQITPADIKAHLSDLVNGGYSQKVINRYASIYAQIFDFACERNECPTNPARLVKCPKTMRMAEKRKPATPAEEKIIREYADTDILPYFLLLTGCRRGEALAVQFKDIDRKAKVIHITKAVQMDSSGHPQIVAPKTAAGIRDVPLLDKLTEVLPRTPKGKADYFLFGGAEPIDSNAYNRRWAKFQRDTGIRLTAHCLRHSYATLLYESGCDTKQAAAALGHADESLTAQLYEHIRESKQRETASKLNALLSK